MRLKLLLLLACDFLLVGALSAQEIKLPRCGTDEYHEGVQDEKSLQQRAHLEEFTRLQSFKTQKEFIGSKYIIPVVVHVVHNGGQDSISYEQVLSEFTVLFNNFRKVPGTQGFGGGIDTHIEFSLATKDPQGNPHSGVTYTRHPLSAMHARNDNLALKSLIRWDTTKYFNVWVVRKIEGGVAGYAQFPWMDGPATDGVVVENRVFGSIGTSETPVSITTHEFGHWLNLFHPFQGSCGTNNCTNSGDAVCDTPPVLDQEFKIVFRRLNSCTNDSPDMADAPRNYMDYLTDYNLANFFTKGQAARMWAVLENPSFVRRHKLWQESNLRATGTGKYGPPKAYFWANKLQTCVGFPVTFIDYSRNQPTEYQWTFPGGEPSTSTEVNPTVVYKRPGKYGATLVVKNLSGISDTFSVQDFITVIDTTYSLPFSEGFENITFPPANWLIEDPDGLARDAGTITWRRRAVGMPGSSAGSAQMRFFIYNDYNQKDGLITPPLDFSKTRNAALIFTRAYTPLFHEAAAEQVGGIQVPRSFLRLYTDTLSIQVSTDCGATWQEIWRKGGIALMTTRNAPRTNTRGEGGEFSSIAPNEWKQDTLDLSQFVGRANVRIKFEAINGFGNHLYIDGIRVDTVKYNLVGISRDLITKNLVVAPNPFSGATTLRFDLIQRAQVKVEILDMNGRIVDTLPPTIYSPGEKTIELTLDKPRGIYFARIWINDEFVTKKLIKY
ncbi:MAG: M43 family zinc metalloprotease [Bacteroidia bacterium]|nr:M43 family zinc metalloprotease [Bacteroidia bacterium]MDW8157756.1 M43 family zinc metalloprotease [Bacteroidia bacterium]